jgi:hypothetical protein
MSAPAMAAGMTEDRRVFTRSAVSLAAGAVVAMTL